MTHNTIIDKIFSLFGFRNEIPRNEFRNPIWGSEDDDDGDELYTRQYSENYNDSLNLHEEFRRMEDMIFGKIGSLFGDMGSFFREDNFHSLGTMTETPESNEGPDHFDSNRLREYFLKPGYHKRSSDQPKKDYDLDGKISSSEISDMLKKKQNEQIVSEIPLYAKSVPGTSFSKTIISTSVRKPDGTIESRRIVKNGNEIVEDTVTYTEPSDKPIDSNLDRASSTLPFDIESNRSITVIPPSFNLMHLLLSSLFKNSHQ